MKRPKASPDAYTLRLTSKSPNLLIPHFLIHSWLYYVADRPLISDATFDTLVARLEESWDGLEHRHKALIDKGLLKTGYYLSYPSIVPHAARSLEALFQ